MAASKKKKNAEVDPAVVVKNFVRQFGKAKLRRFVRLLDQGQSGEEIAQELGVTRERVRQWKNAFGQVIVGYQPNEAVMDVLGKR